MNIRLAGPLLLALAAFAACKGGGSSNDGPIADAGADVLIEADAGADGGPPIEPRGAEIRAKAVVTTVHHACALLVDGRVACWGSNTWGQLGDGTSSTASRPTPYEGAVIVPGLAGVVRLVAGSGNLCFEAGSCGFAGTTCAILGDGSAKCWGLGAHGELGNGKEGREYFEPSPASLNVAGIVDLALGGSTGCAVVQDGTVSCWGSNAGQSLGFTSPECGPYWGFATDTKPPPEQAPCEATPRKVTGVTDAARIAVGGKHQCVVHENGTVMCWGANTFGQIGNGKKDPAPALVAPGGAIADFAAKEIAVGSQHTCALRADGTVACWGGNDFGQLGLGDNEQDDTRAKPNAVAGLANVKSLSFFDRTSLATLSDGTASAWGDVNYLIEVPGSAAIYAPTKVPGIDGASTVATSSFITCAVRADETVSCPRQATNAIRFRDP